MSPEVQRSWEKAETILLKGGTVIDPASGIATESDLFLRSGHVEGISASISREADLIVDLTGLVVSPGFGDLHVHLREPGGEDAETIETGTLAAARGGFTRVACMPNTDPPIDNRGQIEFILRQARASGHCRVHPVAAATVGRQGEQLTDIRELQEAGAVAVSDDGSPIEDAHVMRRLLEYARTWGMLVITHAEEPSLSKAGVMNEGYWSTALGLRGIPAAAEGIAIARDIRLAELADAHLHIAHISTREGVDLLRAAKARGAKVTGETAPHYLMLTDELLKGYDSVYRVNPPLRGEEDRQALIAGIKDGTIDALATDHAPHTQVSKDKELDASPPGMIGLETAAGVALEILHHRAGIDLATIVKLLATHPAQIAGWGGGRIRMGENADLTVFDPAAEWVVDPANFASKARNCPFRNERLRGRVRMTICGGQLTHAEDLAFSPSERLQSQIV